MIIYESYREKRLNCSVISTNKINLLRKFKEQLKQT